jgi:hypothetical protein
MLKKLSTASAVSNLRGHNSDNRFVDSTVIQEAINETLKSIFKKKTWASLCVLIGVEESTAKNRLSGARDYSIADIARLLGSEIGDKIEAAMLEAVEMRPKWFKRRARAEKRSRLIQELKQLQLELEEEENQ